MRSSADGSCHWLMVIDSGSRAMYMAIKLQQFGATQYERCVAREFCITCHSPAGDTLATVKTNSVNIEASGT
jgi:hypothetical protein